MNFRDSGFLKSHIKSILDFYEPHIIDESGGFFQNFKDDGQVFNAGQRHLVSSCRMLFIFCKAYQLFGEEKYLQRARHGFDYIQHYHWDERRQGYNWTLKEGHLADDQINHCYGLAFVMLCCAAAYEIGLDGAKERIESAYRILQERLWDANAGLYADEATADWTVVNSYRGQNANMHCCEAMLAAHEATGEVHYLDRAHAIAKKITVEQADKTDGLIWEHYKENLEIDWEYNKDAPKNLYRPWGFQPGHLTEWAKLLLTLYNHRPEDWMIKRASRLFERAMHYCWDNEGGGLFYGFSPEGTICDDDKYFWVQAESFAAAARLYRSTEDVSYSNWYQKIWDYSWEHMIDHVHGAWFRVLTADNKKYSDAKSIAGGKCDYHTIGACWDVLKSGFAR